MSPTSRRTPACSLVLAAACLLLLASGCPAMKSEAVEPAPVEPPPPPPPEPRPDPRVPELEAETRSLERTILERDAKILELEQRLDSQQRMLDDAIQEVVRAKAKLRSLESRAEAASQMAETEIAYKTLKDKVGEPGPPEMLQIDQMMTQSSQEFEQENFGGALYLSSQAKALIQNAQLKLRLMGDVPTETGEVSFSAPLRLQVMKRSNVRKEPGLEAAVIVTLDEGSAVMGYSHKGDWIKVRLEDGSLGWIHQSLLSAR